MNFGLTPEYVDILKRQGRLSPGFSLPQQPEFGQQDVLRDLIPASTPEEPLTPTTAPEEVQAPVATGPTMAAPGEIMPPTGRPTMPVAPSPAPMPAAAPLPQQPVAREPQRFDAAGSPEELYRRGAESRVEAVQRQAEEQRTSSEEMLRIQEERDQAIADMQRQQQEFDALYQSNLSEKQSDLAQLRQEADEARVDPSRALRGARGVMAVIGAAIGGIGAALANQPNYAMDMLNNAIARDIEAQKIDIGQKRAAVRGAQEDIEAMRQANQDRYWQMGLRRQQLLQGAKAQAEMEAQRLKGTTAGARAMDLVGQIQQEEAKNLMELNKIGQSIAHQNAMTDLSKRQLGLARERLGFEQRTEEARKREREQQVRREQLEKMAKYQQPGMSLTGEKIPSEQDMKDITEARPTTLNYTRGIDEIIEDVKKIGTQIFNTDQAKLLRAKATKTLLGAKNIFELGVLSKQDEELLDKLIPEDPTQWRTDDVLKRLNYLSSSSRKDWSVYARQRGYVDNEFKPFPEQVDPKKIRKSFEAG